MVSCDMRSLLHVGNKGLPWVLRHSTAWGNSLNEAPQVTSEQAGFTFLAASYLQG